VTPPPNQRSTRPLKITLGIAAASLFIGLPFVLTFLIGRDLPDTRVAPWVALVALPTYFAAFAGPILGLIVAVWAVDPRSPDGRRQFTRLIVVAAAIVVILATSLTIAVTLGLLSPASAALLSLSAAVAIAGSIWAGSFIRRRDALDPHPEAPQLEEERALLRRKARRIPWTLAIALATLTLTLFTTWLVTGDAQAIGAPVVFLGLAFCVLAAAIASLTVTAPTIFRSRDLLGTDRARQKRIARAIRKRSADNLPHNEQIATRRYAAWLVVIQPYNLAQALLVLLMLLFLRLSNLTNPEAGLHSFDVVLIAFLVFVPAALILFQRRQMRLLREFAGTQNGGSPTPLPAD
jgi:MFS family permease